MTSQEILIALGQWFAVVAPILGGMRWSVDYLYKKAKPLLELPQAVDKLSTRVGKLEDEVKKSSSIESRLNEIGKSLHDIRNEVALNALKISKLELKAS